MYDKEYFSTDQPQAVFLNCDNDGLQAADGEPDGVEWDNVETVEMSDHPAADAFGTDTFYRLKATVARPIPQPYTISTDDGERTVWLKKPRDTLKRSAWSLDGSYWTHGHPDTDSGMVKSVDDVRGFWDDSQYDVEDEGLKSYLHFPVTDDESKEEIAENRSVSVGFRHKISRVDEYDGEVGKVDGMDEERSIDAYQTDMLFNHVATVHAGRCPIEAGCGVGQDHADEHGHTTPYKGIRTTSGSDAVTDSHSSTDETVAGVTFSGLADGTLEESAIPNDDYEQHYLFPAETKSESSYPVVDAEGNLRKGNVAAAHQLGARGGVADEELQRKLSSLNRQWPEGERPIDMTDDNDTDTSTDDGNGLDLSVDTFSVDYLAAQNDNVADVVEQRDALQESIDELEDFQSEVTDALDAEDTEDALEEIDSLTDLRDQQVADERAEYVETITDHMEDVDEEDLEDESLDSLQTRAETIEQVSAQTDETTAGGETSESTDEETPSAHEQLTGGGKRVTPWS